jgi:hypothetical protein
VLLTYLSFVPLLFQIIYRSMYDSCKCLQLDIISHATFYFIVTIIQATLGLYAHFILPENVELIFFCSNEKSILLILARFWN